MSRRTLGSIKHPAATTFAVGTTMLFHQDAAPIGWTKDTASTLDNSALRIVASTSWASGKQGATAFNSVFGSSKTTGAKTLAEANIPSHTHAVAGNTTASTGSGAGSDREDGSGVVSGATGGGGSHDHTLSLDLNFINMIIASKD